ncbi:MAG: hypothetical protein A2Y78_15500 [Acidobacteria bacterium RBG_13_68_16]|jgi:hypothetical protein|nr:MAG: hypothetical protein A2Y78_15500 [Acidobacteria bacterium RBG_13_68_16]
MTVKRSLSLAVILALVGCATSFNPDRIRSEIAAQTGADPQGILEFTLGPTMLSLARTLFAASGTETVPGSQPLAGLRKLQFAVYNLAPGRAQALDFTRMNVTGWEPTVRKRDATSSTLVLVRGAEGDTVGDIVLVTAGEKEAIFARWTGRLSRKVPEQIGEAIGSGGPDAVKRELMSLTDQPE